MFMVHRSSYHLVIFNIANWEMQTMCFYGPWLPVRYVKSSEATHVFFKPTMTTVAAPARDPLIELGRSVRS